jgi:hypothetical protein
VCAAGRAFEEYQPSQVGGATGRRREGSDSGDRDSGPRAWSPSSCMLTLAFRVRDA